MVQEIIVWVLIAAALGWSIRNICRRFKGQSACGCGCGRCEYSSRCCGASTGAGDARDRDDQKAPSVRPVI